MISVDESRKLTPQLLSLEMYSGLKTRSQALSGIGMPPSAALTLSTLMPTVVKPHSQLTMYWLPGSSAAMVCWIAGSRFFRFGNCALSSLRNRPPSAWIFAQYDDGTTTS